MSNSPVKNHACDACGQIDDHPMVHVQGIWQRDERTAITAPSFHFDCLPTQFEELLGGLPQHAVTVSAIAAARGGIHGGDLRAHIAAQPSDNQVEA